MPTQYVTIKKSEAAFSDYLWGRVERSDSYPEHLGQRAIPVKTYNLGTAEESVTFELQDISQIKRPHFFSFVASVIKLNSFILILFPLFYVLDKNFGSSGILNPVSILFASVSSIFLFAGLNIRNDVYDHISGYDRVNLDLNKKPIRLGWITAQKASRISLLLILLAGVLAVPAALLEPQLLGIIGLSVILFFVGRFARNNSYKQQHSGELILFLLIGPLMAAGFQVAAGSPIDREIIIFGAMWGFAILYLIQVNNFSHIMTSSQAGIRNTMTKLGFDLAQKFLILSWVVFLVGNLVFHYSYSDLHWVLIKGGVLLFVSIPTLLKILHIKSPMGSGLKVVRNEVYRIFLILIFLSSVEIAWSVWVEFT